jgi:phosphatidylinositol kinase/protein kinase (PI-3  family)
MRKESRTFEHLVYLNSLLNTYSFTEKRKIQILNYSIIHATMNLGLIEWVDNAQTMKGIFEDQINLKNIPELKLANIMPDINQ